jgi:hypothetical protein
MTTPKHNPLSDIRKNRAKAALHTYIQTRPEKIGPNEYRVRSRSKPNKFYTVTLGETPTCDCPDHAKRFKGQGTPCKHIWEVLLLEGLEK